MTDTTPHTTGEQRWWAPYALPITAPVARDVLVTITDGRITNLEAKVSRERARDAGATIHDDCVIAPGFVNAHAHIEYAPYGALTDGLSFAGWISDHVQRKRRLSPEQMRAGANLGALQARYAGFTTIGDASFSGDAAHALHDAGMRGRVYLEVFGGLDAAGAEAALAACLDRLAQLPSSPLLDHGISPHAPYTVGEQLYRLVAETGLPWMTHLLESQDELDFLAGHGALYTALADKGFPTPTWREPSPVRALASLLGPHTVVVHGTKASPAELEILADAGAPLAHCPRSNARLGCGRLDLAAVQRAGILLALGTDSPASAGPIDPWAELRSALEQHRASGDDATWPSLATLLRMATLDAAAALGYADLGSLDIGNHADLLAVHVGPVSDPLAAYVLGAGPQDLRGMLIAGRETAVRDRTALDEAHARAADARTMLALPVKHSRESL